MAQESFFSETVNSSRLSEWTSRLSEKYRNPFSTGYQLESTLRVDESTLRILQKIFYTGCGSEPTLRMEEPTLRKLQKFISTGRGSEPTLREEESTLRNNRIPYAEILRIRADSQDTSRLVCQISELQ